jgi:peptidoglycan/LPS O-acetylase OafA/YrhL
MPEPVRGGQRYLPGLDGLRALAVLAVVAYHLGLSWAPGGLLGVGVFFTLSGYLITDLLLGQRARTGSLQLVDFWLRRARRLLPALFVMLAVVTAWVALLYRSQLGALRGAVAASVAYVSNWYLIGQHSSYFARFGPPSPLGHLWSLAVEEQFYLVWPWLLALGLYLSARLARLRRGTGTRAAPGAAAGLGAGGRYGLAAVTLLLAAGSALAMAAFYHPGYDPTRVYDGTDTRAFALFIGAALAFVWPSRPPRRDAGAVSRWCLDGVGVVGLLVIGALIWRTTEYSAFMYRGGLAVLSLATVLVVAAVAAPAGRLGAVLGAGPVRWIGVRSYGIYLWHFPIIALTTPADGRDPASRAALQVAATVAVAALSWHVVEEPVRHGALGRWWKQLRTRPAGPASRGLAWRQGAGVAGGVGAVALAGACLAGIIPALPASLTRPAPHPVAVASPRTRRVTGGGTGTGTGKAQQAVGGGAAGPPRTSCQSVVHVGDSTSDGLISASYLPRKRQRIGAQYRKVGVRHVSFQISGARSIVETWHGEPNARTVAQQMKRQGFRGCWVLALGTNDAADVAVGSPVGLSARITQMMSVIGSQPVMWVNVISLPEAPADYSEAQLSLWNRALVRACAKYPNMRVYDWAAVARPQWFISDGIHYTSAGYAARGRLIAQALAVAFPAAPAATGAATACVVS